MSGARRESQRGTGNGPAEEVRNGAGGGGRRRMDGAPYVVLTWKRQWHIALNGPNRVRTAGMMAISTKLGPDRRFASGLVGSRHDLACSCSILIPFSASGQGHVPTSNSTDIESSWQENANETRTHGSEHLKRIWKPPDPLPQSHLAIY